MKEQCFAILENPASTNEMKIMCIFLLFAEKECTKFGAYELFKEYGIFSKSFFDIDQDCCDLLKEMELM